MLSLSIVDIKGFMAELLKGKSFDDFGLHSVLIHSIAIFEIHRVQNQAQAENEKELKWADIKPFAFEIVKSGTTPKLLKVVFMAAGEIIDLPEANLFLNINFEAGSGDAGGKAVITTGLAQKNFSADKAPNRRWDDYVLNFLSEKNISFIDELA